VLHELDELSVQEIAAGLRLPMATVYTRLRRARLAFAKAVRRLETATEVAAPAALLALQRGGVAVPAGARRRGVARARARLMAPAAPAFPAPLALGAGALLVAALALAVPRLAGPATPTLATRGAGASSRLAEALVGYWDFDEGARSRVAHDRSGHGNDCALTSRDPGRAWIAGAVGGALQLGSHAWLQCPPPATLGPSTEMTVAAWIKRDVTSGYHGALAAVRYYQGSDDDLMFAVLKDALLIRSKAWGVEVEVPLPDPLDRWVHVAFTHAADGATRLFVGGHLAALAHGTRARDLAEAPLFVGASPREDAHHVIQHFYGAMDELAVYARALAAPEIAALAGGARPR
jgi:hypothetical protein